MVRVWRTVAGRLTDNSGITLNLPAGVHQISAIATDAAGQIGMAGVVVNVAVPTKFYVVDDATRQSDV